MDHSKRVLVEDPLDYIAEAQQVLLERALEWEKVGSLDASDTQLIEGLGKHLRNNCADGGGIFWQSGIPS